MIAPPEDPQSSTYSHVVGRQIVFQAKPEIVQAWLPAPWQVRGVKLPASALPTLFS
jgi:hypothetical protein